MGWPPLIYYDICGFHLNTECRKEISISLFCMNCKIYSNIMVVLSKHSSNFESQPHQDLIHAYIQTLSSFFFFSSSPPYLSSFLSFCSFHLSLFISFLHLNFLIFFLPPCFRKCLLNTCAVLTLYWKIISQVEFFLYFIVRSLLAS